jgi:predicted glycosyltransferase
MPSSATSRATLLYCQHSVGLGHLVRSLAVAEALARTHRVVICCGGRVPAELRVPPGVDVVELTPIGTNGDGRLVSLDPTTNLEQAWVQRRDQMVRLVECLELDAVIVELFPFGRRKFAAEILALLEAVRRCNSTTVVVSSVRDLLVTGHRDKAAHDDEAALRLDRYFDAVIVHSDPRFARLEETFAPSRPLSLPVIYSGFVASSPDRPSRRRLRAPREVLVSAGGGMVGGRLFATAVDAHRIHLKPRGFATRIITGPFLPREAAAALRSRVAGDPTVTIETFVPDLCAAMAASEVSVSQCGYNTTLDILRSEVPAVVVPFDDRGETEQTHRASVLERLGRVTVLPVRDLDATALAASVLSAVDLPVATTDVALDGAARAAASIVELVRRRRSGAPSGVPR